MLRNEGKRAYFILWSPGMNVLHVLGPKFNVYALFFKILSSISIMRVSKKD